MNCCNFIWLSCQYNENKDPFVFLDLHTLSNHY
uniref:Uncharacterized protein n=1 Tax=Rhizophora mucronata TaxID=61149 RepID=A0A2P2PX48_RHIMU